MESKRLAQIFKALDSHVSTDETQYNMCHVYADNETTLVATDGRRLLEVTIPAGHGLARGFYDSRASLARLRANVAPELAQVDALFPDYRQAIPRIDDDSALVAASRVALNPEYLADACQALAIVQGKTKLPRIRWTMPSEEISPVVMTAKGDDASALVVLMPIRT